MNNIIMKKIWENKDDKLIELRIFCTNQFIKAMQDCYLSYQNLEFILKKLDDFIQNPNESCYLEFGRKTGNYSPAFSMEIYKINKFKKLEIEVDVEIDDNCERKHRSCFFVKSNFYNVKNFKDSLKSLIDKEKGYKIKLN